MTWLTIVICSWMLLVYLGGEVSGKNYNVQHYLVNYFLFAKNIKLALNKVLLVIDTDII